MLNRFKTGIIAGQYYNIVGNITANTTNLNVYNFAKNLGWNGVERLRMLLTIDSGVTVSSNDSTLPAIIINAFRDAAYDDYVTIINNGNIFGCGGQGGAGGTPTTNYKGNNGLPGGDAIYTTTGCTIVNNGVIRGGGGGGGGAAGVDSDGDEIINAGPFGCMCVVGNGNYTGTTSFDFSGTTTWKVPPNVYFIDVTATGGGAGGGGAQMSANYKDGGGGGGGGGGATGSTKNYPVTPGQVIAINIGAGGGGGYGDVDPNYTAPGHSGYNGGNTTVTVNGTQIVGAVGGQGGQGAGSDNGGAGGIAGSPGGAGGVGGLRGTNANGGNGGNSSIGVGGTGGSEPRNGYWVGPNAVQAPTKGGGGGGGMTQNGSPQGGGKGADGYVTISIPGTNYVPELIHCGDQGIPLGLICGTDRWPVCPSSSCTKSSNISYFSSFIQTTIFPGRPISGINGTNGINTVSNSPNTTPSSGNYLGYPGNDGVNVSGKNSDDIYSGGKGGAAGNYVNGSSHVTNFSALKITNVKGNYV